MNNITCHNCGELNSDKRVLCFLCNSGLWSKKAKEKKHQKSGYNKYNKKENNANNQMKNNIFDSDKHYREILELKGEIKKIKIKKQYRTMMMKYHPDKVNSMGRKIKKVAEEESKEIIKAYNYFKNKYSIN